MEMQFRMKYGTSVDEFLDSIYTAGADLSGDDIEERAKSIERSNRMLKMAYITPFFAGGQWNG